jgi:SNF2 family DNA or RNA helicase
MAGDHRDDFHIKTGRSRSRGTGINPRSPPFVRQVEIAIRRAGGNPSPEGLARVDPGNALHATLRPYQQTGVRWLYLLTQLGLGACLADDMGLGKTIQVLALLLVLGQRTKGAAKKTPSLLVAPASLLANWALEAGRLTPGLNILVAHPSFLPGDELRSMNANRLAAIDLVVTSYATLLRLGWIGEAHWCLVVLDEAQVVKNPNAKQTKAVKSLKAKGALFSPARRSRTICAICGRSSISSIRDCSDHPRPSPIS